MKNNQVYLDPQNLETSMQQLGRVYRLDDRMLAILRRVVEKYPRPVIMYVDEANAPLYTQSPIDDHFTFNTQTDELVLFSRDPLTFVDALIEMWMYISGFETLMGSEDYWKVEFAIGAWKPVRDNLKQALGIPVNHQMQVVVGLPPTPDEAPLDDPFPFLTLVSSLTVVSFAQMVRLAGRPQIRVNFPSGTDYRVSEVYFTMRRAMRQVAQDLSITDAAEFNRRLHDQIEKLEQHYQPNNLPVPAGWQFSGEDRSAASGEMDNSKKDEPEDSKREVGLLLGPSDDEPSIGHLPFGRSHDTAPLIPPEEMEQTTRKLAEGPFAAFIETLFDD